MSQQEIDELVAHVTGEELAVIRQLGFGIADPFDAAFDPEPRRPLVLDWDRMQPVLWQGW